MTDKVQKIREEVEKRYEYWKEKESNSHSIESEIRMSECQHLLLMLNSLQEEPVSKDLEELINTLNKRYPEVSFAKLSRIAVRVAKWQEQQNQSTIELAEDHAYFAGRTKTIDEMMEKAIEITFNVSLPSSLYDKLWVKGCKEGDKLLVIKKDEL